MSGVTAVQGTVVGGTQMANIPAAVSEGRLLRSAWQAVGSPLHGNSPEGGGARLQRRAGS